MANKLKKVVGKKLKQKVLISLRSKLINQIKDRSAKLRNQRMPLSSLSNKISIQSDRNAQVALSLRSWRRPLSSGINRLKSKNSHIMNWLNKIVSDMFASTISGFKPQEVRLVGNWKSRAPKEQTRILIRNLDISPRICTFAKRHENSLKLLAKIWALKILADKLVRLGMP